MFSGVWGNAHLSVWTLYTNMTQASTARNICIIGNIGSGKSTLVKLLGDAIPNSIVVPEKFNRNPFLKRYVEIPPRWAFTNALRYFYDYARVYRECTGKETFDYAFIDAGGATNRDIYGRYLVQKKIMTRAEYEFYSTLCDMIQKDFNYPNPDAYIFLNSSPQECFRRMQKRGWKYQTQNIPVTYLESLQPYFVSLHRRARKRGIPTLTLEREKINLKSAAGKAEALSKVNAFLGI